METIARPPLQRITAVQLLVLPGMAAAAIPLGREYVYSVLAGGLIQVTASAYFAWKAFRYQGARQIKKAVQSMYRGETGKILLTAAFFATVFALLEPVVSLPTVIAAYAAMSVSHALVTAKLLKYHRY